MILKFIKRYSTRHPTILIPSVDILTFAVSKSSMIKIFRHFIHQLYLHIDHKKIRSQRLIFGFKKKMCRTHLCLYIFIITISKERVKMRWEIFQTKSNLLIFINNISLNTNIDKIFSQN